MGGKPPAIARLFVLPAPEDFLLYLFASCLSPNFVDVAKWTREGLGGLKILTLLPRLEQFSKTL